MYLPQKSLFSVDFIAKGGMTQRMTTIIYGINAIDHVTFVDVAIARLSVALSAATSGAPRLFGDRIRRVALAGAAILQR